MRRTTKAGLSAAAIFGLSTEGTITRADGTRILLDGTIEVIPDNESILPTAASISGQIPGQVPTQQAYTPLLPIPSPVQTDLNQLARQAISALRSRPNFRDHVQILKQYHPHMSPAGIEHLALLDVCHSQPADEWLTLADTLHAIVDGRLIRKVDVPAWDELTPLTLNPDK